MQESWKEDVEEMKIAYDIMYIYMYRKSNQFSQIEFN